MIRDQVNDVLLSVQHYSVGYLCWKSLGRFLRIFKNLPFNMSSYLSTWKTWISFEKEGEREGERRERKVK